MDADILDLEQCTESTPKGLRCDLPQDHNGDHIWLTFAWPNITFSLNSGGRVSKTEELRIQIAGLQQKLKRLEGRPQDNFNVGDVIRFVKYFGEDQKTAWGYGYTFVAVKVSPYSQWVCTGRHFDGNKIGWVDLMDYAYDHDDEPTIQYAKNFRNL